MKRSTLLSFFLIVMSALQIHAYQKDSIFVTVNGQKRNMIVFRPNQLPAKSPLMIVTHGMNQSPEYQYGSDKIYEMIDTAKFVVAYLRSNGNTWDTGGTNDQNFVIKTIDEMATRHDIDKDRVYWSGFSMGSMLIHHCIGNMQNKIAAFAPTSGIQFSEEPWNNCSKPVNLLECIAYGDETFGYEEYNIHGYIESYALHDEHTKYSKTVGFKPFNSAWQDGDMEKWTGGPKGGEVWLYSYNNGGHWPTDQNRHLIWNFCKRFSLNQPKAIITQPANETTYLYMTPDQGVTFPDITIEATATAVSGSIAKVEFYDGNTLIDSLSAAPYTTTLIAPKAGNHELRVVVTDTNGKTGESTCTVKCVTSDSEYSLSGTFTTEGVVPQNWYVSDGRVKRVGGGLPFTTGNRLLRFTNEQRSFDYGLLVSSAVNKENGAFARFGDSKARSQMTLHAGRYQFQARLINWNQPEFSPVTVTVEKPDGEVVFSEAYTPTKNVGGNTANKFSSGRSKSFEFEIPETGDYVLSIYTNSAKNADFILAMPTLKVKSFAEETGIKSMNNVQCTMNNDAVYDLSGRRISSQFLRPFGSKRAKLERSVLSYQLRKGIYIVDGKKVVIK